jgi:predicted metalloprotease
VPRGRGGGIAGALGLAASVVVIGVLGLSAFGAASRGGGVTSGGGRTPGKVSRAAAVDSPLYRTGALASVGCRLPRIAAGSSPSMERFMERLTACLDKGWARQFGRADLSFARPQRIFWSQPGRSPCGSYPQPGAAAFYCAANKTMYVGLEHVIETAGGEPVSHYAVYARVIAHEYGHHVQEEAEILAYGHQRMDQPSVSARTEASRRIELQAQCFAGAFIGAERRTLPMTQEQYRAMLLDVSGRGDERQPPERRDHGSGRHYAGWVVTGYTKRNLSVCNTWTATPSEVS